MFILFNYRFYYRRPLLSDCTFQCLFNPEIDVCFFLVLFTICLFIMVDTVTAMGNDHDDWEVAVDTGEFDKRLEQLEKERAATQVIF